MKNLKAGAVLLTLWAGLNLFVAAAVTVAILLGRAPPVLEMVLKGPALTAVDAKALAVVNAQATLANPCIAALCGLVLAIVWTSLIHRARWAWWTLAGALCPLQAFGFVSDSYLGHQNLVANSTSTLILLSGLALTSSVGRAPR